MSEMNRREFVAAAAAGCAACLFCGGGETMAAAPAKVTPVDVGTLEQYPRDDVYDQFVSSGKFFLIRNGDRLYAVGVSCTHKQFPVTVERSDTLLFQCTKHGSRFAPDGKVLKGPARKPLPRLAIQLDARKHIIVDPTKAFDEPKWNDPASFIKVKAAE